MAHRPTDRTIMCLMRVAGCCGPGISILFGLASTLACSTSTEDRGRGDAGVPETGAVTTGDTGGTGSPEAGGTGGRASGCSIAEPYTVYDYVDVRLYPTALGLRAVAWAYEPWIVDDVYGTRSSVTWTSIAMDGSFAATRGLVLDDGGLEVIVGTPNLQVSGGLGELRVGQFDDHAVVSPTRPIWTAPRTDAGSGIYLMDLRLVLTPGDAAVFWTQDLETPGNQVQLARISAAGDLREPPRAVPLDAPVDRVVQIEALPDGFALLYTRADKPTELLYVSLDGQAVPRQAAVPVGDIAAASVLGRSAPMLVLEDHVVVASTRLAGSDGDRDAARSIELVRLDFAGRPVGAPLPLQAAVEDWEFSPAAWITSGPNVGLIWSGFDIVYSCRSCDSYHSVLRFALLDDDLAIQGDVVEIPAGDRGRFHNVDAAWQGPSILVTARVDRTSGEHEENDYTIVQPLQCDLR